MVEEIKNKLVNSIGSLTNIEEEIEALLQEQSNIDKMISDVEHYIETHKLQAAASYRFCKRLMELRQRRKEINILLEVNRTYESNKDKLNLKGNRQLLIANINKTYKDYVKSEYQYRVYTLAELEKLDRGDKHD